MAKRGDTTTATIEDVAAAAQVSVATVSRAVRGLPNVAPATRTRVLQVARELSYRADPNASRLAKGRSNAVAMAVPVLSGWYASQAISGAEAVLRDCGYDLLVLGVTPDGDSDEIVPQLHGFEKRADGLILVDAEPADEEVAELAASGLAVVTIGHATPHLQSIVNDELAAAECAVGHLTSLGHRRIGLIGTVSGNRRTRDGRRDGYRSALAAAGIELDPELEEVGEYSIQGGREAMIELLKTEPRPTAVFAVCDEMAMAAIKVCRENNLRVPEDVSVIGFDDHELAEVMDLTTIRQSVVANGAWAARTLMELMEEEERAPSYEPLVSATELVVRGTTAPPAG